MSTLSAACFSLESNVIKFVVVAVIATFLLSGVANAVSDARGRLAVAAATGTH